MQYKRRIVFGIKNKEFSFSKTSYHTKAKELSLPNYLPIAEGGGRIVGFYIDIRNREPYHITLFWWRLAFGIISDGKTFLRCCITIIRVVILKLEVKRDLVLNHFSWYENTA